MGQDIFEKKIDQAYKNCKGVGRIDDDVQSLITYNVLKRGQTWSEEGRNQCTNTDTQK